MGYDKQEAGYRGGSLLQNLGWLLTGGIAVAALLGGTEVWQMGDRVLSTVRHFFHPALPVPKVEVQSVVMQQMRSVSELTTASFTMQAVVPTSQNTTFSGFVVGTTKLLYIAYGEVKAGVDLQNLTPANVQVTENNLRIQLPPPQLLDRKIDVNRSTVYDYSRGTLGLGPDVAPTLQVLAQQEALKKIVEAACTDGVLEKANDRAKLVLTQLLTTTGYPNVVVVTQPPAPGSCLVPPAGK